MNKPKFSEKVMVGLDNVPPSFNVRGKLVGPNGANLQHIANQTKAIVTVRGRGSGCIEDTGLESAEPLHICIEHAEAGVVQAGRQLAFELIDKVQKDWSNLHGPMQQKQMQHQKSPHQQQQPQELPSGACRFCGTIFRKNRKRHEETCSLNREARTGFQCSQCSLMFTRKDSLVKHMRKCGECDIFTSKYKRSCPMENCGQKFFFKEQLVDHLRTVHASDGLDIEEPVFLEFSCFEDFKVWKEEEEERTFSYFSQRTGKYNGVRHYYCQRDGPVRGFTPKTSRRNVKGIIKTGQSCIAEMKATFTDSVVKVEYQRTHCHPCRPDDFVHHPLSSSTYEYIDEQLARDVSPSEIHRTLTDNHIIKELVDHQYDHQPMKNALTLNLKRIQARARKLKNDQRLEAEHKPLGIATLPQPTPSTSRAECTASNCLLYLDEIANAIAEKDHPEHVLASTADMLKQLRSQLLSSSSSVKPSPNQRQKTQKSQMLPLKTKKRRKIVRNSFVTSGED